MKYHQRREFLREIEKLAKSGEETYLNRVRGMMWKARAWLIGSLAFGGALAVGGSALGCTGFAPWWIGLGMATLGSVLFLVAAGVAFLRIDPPEGIDIAREAYPLLFKDLRELRKKCDAPRFTDVRFTMDMGAAMVEVPRLFGLLPSRNYLIIGMPLLLGVTREEFLAILAHELAHLSRRHNRLTRSVYRLRVQLARTRNRLVQAKKGRRNLGEQTGLMDFWERFELATRRIARIHELEADRISARLSTPQTAAIALCKAHVLSRHWSEHFEREIEQRMVHSDIPNITPLGRLRRHLETGDIEKEFSALLNKELRRKTCPEDTHPALAERLAELGQSPIIQWKASESAGKTFFGRELDKVCAEFDKYWVSWILPIWRDRNEKHRRAREYGARLRGMEKRGEKLCLGELWSMASIDERQLNHTNAAVGYERFLATFPEALEAKLALGRVLRDKDSQRSEQLLRDVALTHPVLWIPARDLLLEQLRAQGRVGEMDQLELAIEKAHGDSEKVLIERLEVRANDKFVSPELDKTATDAIYNLAGQLGTIRRLWILERKPTHFPEIRDFVVLFDPTADAAANRLLDSTASILASEIYLPGTFIVCRTTFRNGFLRGRARKLAGTEIFAKND